MYMKFNCFVCLTLFCNIPRIDIVIYLFQNKMYNDCVFPLNSIKKVQRHNDIVKLNWGFENNNTI